MLAALGDRKTRFRKEAEAWVQLGSHPNIVRCLWVNEIDGNLYVAAEYIAPDEDGLSTLDDRLRLGKIVDEFMDREVKSAGQWKGIVKNWIDRFVADVGAEKDAQTIGPERVISHLERD